MDKLTAIAVTWMLTVRDRVRGAVRDGGDAGMTTNEIVYWTVGLLLLAVTVFTAVNAYITSKLPGITG